MSTELDFKTLLKRLRVERGLSQREVADGLAAHGGAVSDASVSLWESGGNISYEKARSLADFFGEPRLLTLAGYDTDELVTLRDEYELLKAQFAVQGEAIAAQADTIAELTRIVNDLARRLR